KRTAFHIKISVESLYLLTDRPQSDPSRHAGRRRPQLGDVEPDPVIPYREHYPDPGCTKAGIDARRLRMPQNIGKRLLHGPVNQRLYLEHRLQRQRVEPKLPFESIRNPADLPKLAQ